MIVQSKRVEGKLLAVSQGVIDPIVRRAMERVAHKQDLETARSMASQLVNDEDGHWLAQVLDQVRRGKAIGTDPTASVTLEVDRVFHFRGSKPAHNMTDADAPKYYRTFSMPAGSRVTKTGGEGYANWVLRVDNGLEGSEWVYFTVAYKHCDMPRRWEFVLKSYPTAQQVGQSGRRAGSRSRGHGPDKSISR